MKKKKLLKVLLKMQKSEITALHMIIAKLILVNEGVGSPDDGPVPEMKLGLQKETVQPDPPAVTDYHQ